jgi:hypothetical protein
MLTNISDAIEVTRVPLASRIAEPDRSYDFHDFGSTGRMKLVSQSDCRGNYGVHFKNRVALEVLEVEDLCVPERGSRQ